MTIRAKDFYRHLKCFELNSPETIRDNGAKPKAQPIYMPTAYNAVKFVEMIK